MRLGGWILVGSVMGSLSVLSAEGCSSSSSSTAGSLCSTRQACLQSPIPSSVEVAACQQQLDDPTCGTQFKEYKECLIYRAVCLSSGQVNTSATSSVCSSLQSAYNSCVRTRPPDGGPVDGCRPRTCATANANCGQIDDGCGAQLFCGSCGSGQVCGAQRPNVCGCPSLTCTPGTTCGVITGCGQTVDCGGCNAPNWCGGGGTPNQCGCLPAGDFGPRNPSGASVATIAIDGGTTVSWSSPTAVLASDNSYAQASFSTAGVTQTSQFLLAVDFRNTIPSNATVDGIKVEIERASQAAQVVDNAVYVIKSGQPITQGTNLANPGVWSAVETTVAYGGPTEKWGQTWTPADVNSAGFGVAISVRTPGGVQDAARIDNVRVTITYSGATCQ
jgi:hypothetical protein